ncbi:hypothetical protein OC835_000165 [Tilletia horrida]|nr:hypothetical protein OC835_000165 [Tilletia horrida]
MPQDRFPIPKKTYARISGFGGRIPPRQLTTNTSQPGPSPQPQSQHDPKPKRSRQAAPSPEPLTSAVPAHPPAVKVPKGASVSVSACAGEPVVQPPSRPVHGPTAYHSKNDIVHGNSRYVAKLGVNFVNGYPVKGTGGRRPRAQVPAKREDKDAGSSVEGKVKRRRK